MAKIPPLQRLGVEDFPEQAAWIGKLLQPVNTSNESVVSALDRRLTLRENLAADIRTVVFETVPTATSPLKVAWTQSNRPESVQVGNVRRMDGAAFTITNAVQVQWEYTDSLRITNIVGITPSGTTKYLVTLVIFTG